MALFLDRALDGAPDSKAFSLGVRAVRPVSANILTAGKAAPGRTYRVWSEPLGRVLNGERIGWGRGAWRETVFFRGDVGRGDERRTMVVGVHQDDNVKFVPPQEVGE